MEEAPTTRDKEAFYRELDRLDDLTDDQRSEDQSPEDDLSRLIAKSRDKTRHKGSTNALVPTSAASSAAVNATKPVRANTAPECSSQIVAGSSLDPKHKEPGEMTKRPVLKGAKTTGALTESKTEDPPPVKRRRTYAARTIPEQQQVFKGLVFFFFPNSDVSPLRRLRIQRAQEYGALWAKSWDGEAVSHVIVDKGMVYNEILRHLKLESIPSTIAVVDESYPSECIKFRSVLNPAQSRFRVNGTPASVVEEQPLDQAARQSSDDSLPLKEPKGKRQKTPTPSEQSSCGQVDPGPVQRPVNVEDVAGRERDILDDIIDEAKATKDLPLEDDGAHDSSGSDSEDHGKPVPKEDPAVDAWQQKFACMQKHEQSSDAKCPNSRTIEVLQQMLGYYERTADHWRVIAYRKAISALRRQSKRVVTRKQAREIPGIGPRLADKIEEIVFTNRLRRLENASSGPEDLALQEFLGVYGAGISQASQWVARGYRTLDDLKTKATLTKQQRIGVDHYTDFQQRIPRQEVEAHGAIVRHAVQRADPSMQAIIGGSYRRGASSSGDIDILITKPDTTIEHIRTVMMDVVVPDLFQQGFLQASLAASSSSRADGSKWHGASALPHSTTNTSTTSSSVWRRIDLLFVPGVEIGAALIYFTGNDIFNRSLRLLASRKGMRLNQRGLYQDVLRGEKRKKLTEGRLVEGHDERRIFEQLGVPWRPPEHRIC